MIDYSWEHESNCWAEMEAAWQESRNKWDKRFLSLAEFVASWSRDPSTQVGAVVAEGKRIVSVGFNGFPQGVDDSPERYADRDVKNKMVVHAERNAILFAKRDLKGCVLYTFPFQPCSVCAGIIIQSGIVRVAAPRMSEDVASRWKEDCELAETMFREAGVKVDIL